MALQSIMFYEMSNIHCNAHMGIKCEIISWSQTTKQLKRKFGCRKLPKMCQTFQPDRGDSSWDSKQSSIQYLTREVIMELMTRYDPNLGW